MFKRILLITMVATVISGCGAVLENPEIESAEFKKELAHQRKILADYKRKNKDKLTSKQMHSDILEYDNYFGSQMDRMLVSAQDFCKYKMYSSGIRHTDIKQGRYKGKQIVYGVTKGFPAYEAGIRKGDIILAINYMAPSSYKKVFNQFSKRQNNSVIYYSTQEKKKKTVKITGKLSCQMLLITSSDKVMNAMADGRAIYMYPELYNFLGKDEYINTVIAHEIAHNIMSHNQRTQINLGVGSLAGMGLAVLLGASDGNTETLMDLGGAVAQSYSPEFEAEADYMGLYVMARAGYNIDKSADTWRRMTMLSSDSGLGRDSSHPAPPKRFIAIKKAMKEIKDKIKKSQPLNPEFQSGEWARMMDWGKIKSMQKSIY